MRIHWHRRDLRLTDNPALVADESPVIGCFVFDPAVLAHAGTPRVNFLINCIATLRRNYRQGGGDLIVRTGDPIEQLLRLHDETDIDAISWEQDYSGFARQRDGTVRKQLEEHDIDVISRDGAVCHPPGDITTQNGDPYKVFSYYGKKWLQREKATSANPPAEYLDCDVVPGTIPDPDEYVDSELTATLPPAGTDAAHERLDSFCSGPIETYSNQRDMPAEEGTSRISQDLHFGTIGIRTVWEATERTKRDTEATASIEEFQRQLAWREFYTQVIWDRPDTVHAPFKTFEQPVQWRDDPAGVQRWKDGTTGFPIVDAGMRQLRQEAWMHNRVRMIVASFLTKDLLVDWRVGYAWFRAQLVDHDTANDVGGWQWAASTGTDAQPYFRIFNPMTQSERYDPNARYIKRYVPALKDVAPEAIHTWDEMSSEARNRIAPDYPAPIVDHAKRREMALQMFQTARGDA